MVNFQSCRKAGNEGLEKHRSLEGKTSMIITSYRISADSLVPLDESDAVLEQWRLGEESYWVDIHAFDTDQLEAWLNNFNLTDLAMKCCLETGQTTRYLPLHEEVFFKFPVCPQDVDSEPAHLSFLCVKNLVITLHSAPLDSLDGTIKGLTSELTLTHSHSAISALVCLLLLVESAKSLKISEGLKKAIFDLDERMDDDPDSVDADEILDQKRSLRVLDTVVGTQLSCFELIGSLNRPILDLKALATQFQFAPSNVREANQNVDRLEKTIADIRQRFDMNQQEKTNHRLAILTILSAIFMPLTFIAGIYGMNFDKMPELHFPYSYPVALVVMALIAVGMYLYFRTRGWLE